MLRFASPEAFALLALVPIAIAARWWLARRRSVLFGSLIPVDGVGTTWRVRLRHAPAALRCVAVALFVVAVARPQHGTGEVEVTAEGVAMMAVVDRSWSMTEPMSFGGQELRRIDVVKRVFRDFVLGDGAELGGRPHDLIGLVTFARFAETVCPPVRDGALVVGMVDSVGLVDPRVNRTEAGTAIGQGLALAAARLGELEEGGEDPEGAGGGVTIGSRAVILMTDGSENVGDPSARRAAELCAELGVTVYAIGIGGGERRRPAGPFGALGRGGFEFDEQTLREVAQITGGAFFAARDAEALRRVYEEIDELERTRIETVEFTSYDEAFGPWVLAALAVLVLESLLASTLLRGSP